MRAFRRLPRARAARRIVERVLACVAALALLLAVVRGGSAFFYCAPMQAVMSAPCCAGHESVDSHGDDATASGGAVVAAQCCQKGRLAVLAPAPLPAAPPEVAAPPPLATVLPRIDALADSRSSAQVGHVAPDVGAGPPTALERRAELMVFHL